jgi:exopolysaccharide biosynthesis polyprenyl glycosylphosphotransferase
MTVKTGYANVDNGPTADTFFPARSLYTYLFHLALLVSDSMMVVLAFGVAYSLRFPLGFALESDVPEEPDKYLRLILILIPLWLVLFWLMRLYDSRYLLGGTSEYARAANACTSGMMLVVLASFLVDVPETRIARAWLVYAWILSMFFVCGGRLMLRRVAYRLRRHGFFVARTIIVGINAEALALAEQLRNSQASGLAIVGFIDTQSDVTDEQRPHKYAGLPVLGDLESLPEVVQGRRIEEVVIATTALTREQMMQIAGRLVTLPSVVMRLSSGLYEIFTTGMHVTTRNYVPLMSLNRLRLDAIELTSKALLDYTAILFSLPFLLPLFLVIAALIKVDSPGPVFYRRRVLGIGGNEFDALKFRTMAVNGDEILARRPDLHAELAANHKLKEDPRVTRVGKWLRRTSLDELPQLINVLLGQMSLVGPRMISPVEKEQYGQMQHNLLTVKPGLTGLWQVSGRSDLSYVERVQLDMHYIRNYSIWLDVQILFFQTLPAVLKKRGAY